MRLMVTRPSFDADRTAGRLRSLGHDATVASLIRIEFAAQPVEWPDPVAIVFSSSNGVRALAKWPILAEWCDRTVYAVADRTAMVARDAGFTQIRIGRGDARGLFDLVRTTLDPQAGPLLYPTFPGAPERLPHELATAGFSVFVVNAYRRVPLDALDDETADALTGGEVDGMLFYSRGTAKIFADLARKKGIADRLDKVAFYALAEPIVEPLRDLNTGEVWVAEKPSEDALFELITGPAEPHVT
jgi:uroporphyrinogen-III synthase